MSFTALSGLVFLMMAASMPAFAASDGEIIGDYNVGGGLLVNGTEATAGSSFTVDGGVVGNAEVVAMANMKDKHYVVLDGRFITFAGGGVRVTGDEAAPVFALRLMGNASFGIQAFKVVPLNLSFEDVELKVNGSDVEGKALIGTTIYLPVSLLTDMDSRNLFIAITAGARLNSEAEGSAFALQPKIRYIDDKFSGEARYLVTIGGDSQEHRGVMQLGLNHVFMRGDQLGLMVTKGVITHGDGKKIDITEGLLFYGGNL